MSVDAKAIPKEEGKAKRILRTFIDIQAWTLIAQYASIHCVETNLFLASPATISFMKCALQTIWLPQMLRTTDARIVVAQIRYEPPSGILAINVFHDDDLAGQTSCLQKKTAALDVPLNQAMRALGRLC